MDEEEEEVNEDELVKVELVEDGNLLNTMSVQGRGSDRVMRERCEEWTHTLRVGCAWEHSVIALRDGDARRLNLFLISCVGIRTNMASLPSPLLSQTQCSSTYIDWWSIRIYKGINLTSPPTSHL